MKGYDEEILLPVRGLFQDNQNIPDFRFSYDEPEDADWLDIVPHIPEPRRKRRLPGDLMPD